MDEVYEILDRFDGWTLTKGIGSTPNFQATIFTKERGGFIGVGNTLEEAVLNAQDVYENYPLLKRDHPELVGEE